MGGIVLVAIAAGLWGTIGVANSLMTGQAPVDAALVGLTRTALGAASLLLAAAALRVPRTSRPPLGALALFGVAGAVFQTCLFAAFAKVGVTVTVAVTVCAPVVLVTAGDAVWRRRLPDAGVAVAIVVASAGVVLAMFGGQGWVRSALSIDPGGVFLLTAASIAFAIVAATARVMARGVHPLRASGLGLAATAAALAVVVAARSPSLSELTALPGRDLAILLYTGVFATGGAYLAFVLGLTLSCSAAAGLAATLIEPGVAAVLAALVLRERLAGAEALGCALMLAAMVVLFVAERPSATATRSAARQAARIS